MYKMLNCFNCFMNIPCFRTPLPLIIHNFKEVRYVSTEFSYPNNYFVNKKTDAILLEYYDKNEKIGYIRFYFTTGQIGSFFIDAEYQNRGLGKQILSKVIKELKVNNCKEVWAVTSTDHPFWSNVYNNSFTYRDPAHPSVSGNGYFMKI